MLSNFSPWFQSSFYFELNRVELVQYFAHAQRRALFGEKFSLEGSMNTIFVISLVCGVTSVHELVGKKFN